MSSRLRSMVNSALGASLRLARVLAGVAFVVTVGPWHSRAESGFAKFIETPPFWVGKPKLEEKLKNERAIIVSVATVKTDKKIAGRDVDRFSIQGVGLVRRDAETAFKLLQEYERFKEISDHFREVKFEAKTSRVFVVAQALGYQARMLFKVDPKPTVTAGPQATVATGPQLTNELRFEVIDGHFQGLQGVLGLKKPAADSGHAPTGGATTEISVRILHEASEIPIPRILVGVALEFLVQRVAGEMRRHLETASPKIP